MNTKAIEVKRTKSNGPIKLYANVPSDSMPGVVYTVVYIRTKGMERWNCTCPNQVITQSPRRKHCKHIKRVRALTPGRHGAGSMRQTPTAAPKPVAPNPDVKPLRCAICGATDCPYDPMRKKG